MLISFFAALLGVGSEAVAALGCDDDVKKRLGGSLGIEPNKNNAQNLYGNQQSNGYSNNYQSNYSGHSQYGRGNGIETFPKSF